MVEDKRVILSIPILSMHLLIVSMSTLLVNIAGEHKYFKQKLVCQVPVQIRCAFVVHGAAERRDGDQLALLLATYTCTRICGERHRILPPHFTASRCPQVAIRRGEEGIIGDLPGTATNKMYEGFETMKLWPHICGTLSGSKSFPPLLVFPAQTF